MTEAELDGMISERIQNDEAGARQLLRERRSRRRKTKNLKNDRRMRIVLSGGIDPFRGYLDREFQGHTLLHSGSYVKYLKSHECRQFERHVTTKRARCCQDLPPKGNLYRRLGDMYSLY